VPNPEPASPPPSPESAPPPSGAASSAASSRASQSESGFVADAGPEFDPDAAGAEMPEPPAPAGEPAALIEWEEDTIKALLTLKGRGIHAMIGVAEQDWRYTELDLAAIAPPLTRICNRYEPIQRFAKYSDPLTLAFALGAYGVRSLEERQVMIAAMQGEEGTVPIAPAGPEPPVPTSEAPTPAPRQAASFPTSAPGPAPAMQPSEGPAPTSAPRPAEADVDPTEVEWEVGNG
jgi:hypothetical protein